MLCPSLTETTCSNLTTVFTSTGRISANVCVCRACLPQLEIAAERNLKNVCFFSPESYLVIIIGIQILLLFENGGKLTWIGFSLWRPRWTEWVLIPDDFWKKKRIDMGEFPGVSPSRSMLDLLLWAGLFLLWIQCPVENENPWVLHDLECLRFLHACLILLSKSYWSIDFFSKNL